MIKLSNSAIGPDLTFVTEAAATAVLVPTVHMWIALAHALDATLVNHRFAVSHAAAVAAALAAPRASAAATSAASTITTAGAAAAGVSTTAPWKRPPAVASSPHRAVPPTLAYVITLI